MMLGLLLIILWPIMGFAAFLAALVWFSFRVSGRIHAKRFFLTWMGIALGLSALCVLVDATRIFIIPGSGWPDFLFYGPLMIWPLPVGIFLGGGLVRLTRFALSR
jgi:hypothetical protein